MTLAEATAFLERVTYKPGVQIRLLEWTGGNLEIRISFDAPDAEGSGKVSPLRSVYYIRSVDLLDNGEMWLAQQVSRAIRRVEGHEFDEWFRIDGKPVTEPHPAMFSGRTWRP